MANPVAIIFESISTLVSPAIEAGFDYVEYRIAAREKRNGQFRVSNKQSNAVSGSDVVESADLRQLRLS